MNIHTHIQLMIPEKVSLLGNPRAPYQVKTLDNGRFLSLLLVTGASRTQSTPLFPLLCFLPSNAYRLTICRIFLYGKEHSHHVRRSLSIGVVRSNPLRVVLETVRSGDSILCSRWTISVTSARESFPLRNAQKGEGSRSKLSRCGKFRTHLRCPLPP